MGLANGANDSGDRLYHLRLLGRKLPQKRLERISSPTAQHLYDAFEEQRTAFVEMPHPEDSLVQTYRRTIMLFQSIDESFLSEDNQVEIFTTGITFLTGY